MPRSGVYDMPEFEYHSHPALSSSGARRLLPPSCPALFDYERRNGERPRAIFDFGHAAHRMVLGVGAELAVIDAPDWRTKAAKEARDEARARGAVPILVVDHAQVLAMAEAIRRHPIASLIFAPGSGNPEQSLFWTDRRTGVSCRARLDWLPNAAGGRLIVADYKTTNDASPDAVGRSMYDHGYHQQAAWYLDGARALGLGGRDAAFVLVAQEKTPPYLITVAQPDTTALRIGAWRNNEARELFAQCTEAGHWPGYSDEVELVSLPPWAEREYEGVAW